MPAQSLPSHRLILIATSLLTILLLAGCADRTATPEPIATAANTATPSPVPTTTPAPTDETAAANPEIGPTLCVVDAVLVEEPDPMTVSAGSSFRPRWKVRNSGTCPWTSGFALVPVGEGLATESAALPEIAPGEEAEVTVPVVAPQTPGRYRGVWQVQAPDGTLIAAELPLAVEVPTGTPPTDEYAYLALDAGNGCYYHGLFVADISVPDDTIFQPGETFTKTWRLRNAGTCVWREGFSLRWVEDDPLGEQISFAVPAAAPGDEVDVTVSLTAPVEAGTYTSIWRLHTDTGEPFGMLPYVRIKVSAPTPTPAPTATATPEPEKISDYVYNVTATSREIYLAGQTIGNRANVFSQVGDSMSHAWHFLAPIGEGLTQLYDYSYLWPVIERFGTENARISNSFANPSLAEHYGWTSADLLDPANGEPGCAGRSPLVCELEVVRPSIAIIMIGSNDSTAGVSVATYRANFQTIVDTCLNYGVIPVVSTVPWNRYANIDPYNKVVLSVAVAEDIPWMDYHALMLTAPNRGLGEDGMHPSIPPDNNPANFSEDNLLYGYTLRNMLTLETLNLVWKGAMY